MWLTDSFLVTFLEGGGEQYIYMLIHIQLPYTVINMQDGVRGAFQTSETLESLNNFKLF